MPPSYYSIGCPSLPHLSEIIELEPEKEPWCAGYAPSQRRRCHARTNAHGRRSAMQLLNKGTEMLRAGWCINILLEDLAPHVLCRRFHQYQASDLIARWQRKIQTFLSSQPPTSSSSRLANSPFGTNYRESSGESVDLLLQRISVGVVESRHIHAAHQVSSLVPSPPRYNHADRTGGGINLNIIRNENISNDSNASRAATTRPTRTIIQSTYSASLGVTSMRTTQTARRPRFSHISNYTVSTTSTTHSGSDSASTRADPSVTLHSTVTVPHPALATRRCVKGDCVICLSPLKESHSDSVDEASAAEDGEGDRHDDDDDDEEEVEESSTSEQGTIEKEELVWCKVQCGVNFHKKCIEQWFKTSRRSTCPTCRSAWKY